MNAISFMVSFLFQAARWNTPQTPKKCFKLVQNEISSVIPIPSHNRCLLAPYQSSDSNHWHSSAERSTLPAKRSKKFYNGGGGGGRGVREDERKQDVAQQFLNIMFKFLEHNYFPVGVILAQCCLYQIRMKLCQSTEINKPGKQLEGTIAISVGIEFH